MTAAALSVLVVTADVLAHDAELNSLVSTADQSVVVSSGNTLWRDANRGWLVVDYFCRPESNVELLCETMGRVGHLLTEASGSFLFIGKSGVRPETVSACLNDPWALTDEIEDEGQLGALGLGSNIARHPLLPVIFNAIRTTEVDGFFLCALISNLIRAT